MSSKYSYPKILLKKKNYDTRPKKKKKPSLHAQSACNEASTHITKSLMT